MIPYIATHELIPRLIAMDRSDHPVTVLVSFTDRIVSPITSRVRIPSHIEPMAPITLRMLLGFKQSVDQARLGFERLGFERLVSNVLSNLLRGR
jgi:hypothetical protein